MPGRLNEWPQKTRQDFVARVVRELPSHLILSPLLSPHLLLRRFRGHAHPSTPVRQRVDARRQAEQCKGLLRENGRRAKEHRAGDVLRGNVQRVPPGTRGTDHDRETESREGGRSVSAAGSLMAVMLFLSAPLPSRTPRLTHCLRLACLHLPWHPPPALRRPVLATHTHTTDAYTDRRGNVDEILQCTGAGAACA